MNADAARIGVVVVSFRSPERTCAFVTEQLPRLNMPYAVCVVDVASTPATRQALEAGLPPQAFRLFYSDNLGYSRGNNRGAELLRQKCPTLEYLLICNDDILLDTEAHLERLVEFLDAHTDCGIVGPNAKGTDGLPQSPWNTPDDLGAREHRGKHIEPFGGPPRECYAVRGCLLLIRSNAFFQVGGFDEEYFLFFEEPALGEKFRKIGLSTWYLPQAQVTHLGSATIKKSLSSWKIYRIYRKSFLLTAKKYWGWSTWKCLTWPIRHLLAKF